MFRSELPKANWLFVVLVVCCGPSANAQHDHGGETTVRAPRIFLDKSPRIVAYQLKRLSNEQLLLVETATDDVKYVPVFQAILAREGMSRAYREQALADLVQVKQSDAVSELSAVMATLKPGDSGSQRTLKALGRLLLSQPTETLQAAREQLVAMLDGDEPALVPVAYGGLITAGDLDAAWSQAQANRQLPSLMDSTTLIPKAPIRNTLHRLAIELLDSENAEARAAAVRALGTMTESASQTFKRVASLVDQSTVRADAIRTLLKVPLDQRDQTTGGELIEWLVDYAESTPAAQRTENDFLDAMELVDQLLGQARPEIAKAYRARLRQTVVRVIRIHTVEEEMRYDVPFFAVEAGRPVQVVLINEDLMPHNLVVTQPGALQSVAEEALTVGADGADGKQYVPDNDQVLHATHMIPAGGIERLTFDAPEKPGEYPYVCTFPRHWMRMYGVMVVVEDLDAWQRNPVEPKDPIGSNRQFVKSWNVEDFQTDMDSGLRGRSPEIGQRMFVEATCAQCHRAGAVGVGEVGPELTGTYAKFQGNSLAVLQEILDPSHRIDDKYAVHLVLDLDGKTQSGLVLEQDKEKIVLLVNPEAKEPTTILQDDVDQIIKTSNSMMPKGLMDRFTKDEIFELMSFLQSIQTKP